MVGYIEVGFLTSRVGVEFYSPLTILFDRWWYCGSVVMGGVVRLRLIFLVL